MQHYHPNFKTIVFYDIKKYLNIHTKARDMSSTLFLFLISIEMDAEKSICVIVNTKEIAKCVSLYPFFHARMNSVRAWPDIKC